MFMHWPSVFHDQNIRSSHAMAYMTVSTFFNNEIAGTRCFLIPVSTSSAVLGFRTIKSTHCSKRVKSRQGPRFAILSVRVNCEAWLLLLASVSSWYIVVVGVRLKTSNTMQERTMGSTDWFIHEQTSRNDFRSCRGSCEWQLVGNSID